jgi:predicted nucleic-acid-binding protein
MLAIDTNVLVRFLTGDDPEQAATARELFAREPIWIAKTVLLEAEWVLRSAYGFEPGAVRDALKKTISLPNVGTEDPQAVLSALALAAHGITLADALHLTSTPQGGEFVSFDRAFIRRAKRAGAANVRDLSSMR